MINSKNRNKNIITRRDFLKGATYSTLGITLGLNKIKLLAQSAKNEIPFSAQKPVSKVVLIRHEEVIDQKNKINKDILTGMIDKAITVFSGETNITESWRKYVSPEDIVGIKFTHCEWMRVPTETSLIDIIKKRISESGIQKSKIHTEDYGLPIKKCTALINVPSVKVHSLTGIAASIKNYINFINNPSDYHHEKSINLGDIWLKPHVKGKTRLIIVDLLRPYFGPGPQINPLHRWQYKGILVGTDPVAIDTVCTTICQQKRNLFKGEEWPISPPPISIEKADTKYKLGTSDPFKIKLDRLGWEKDILV